MKYHIICDLKEGRNTMELKFGKHSQKAMLGGLCAVAVLSSGGAVSAVRVDPTGKPYIHVTWRMKDKEKRVTRAKNLCQAVGSLDIKEVERLTSRPDKGIDEDTIYFIEDGSSNKTVSIFDQLAEMYDRFTDESQKKKCLQMIKMIAKSRSYLSDTDRLGPELGNEKVCDTDGLYRCVFTDLKREGARPVISPLAKGIIKGWNIEVIKAFLGIRPKELTYGIGVKHHGSLIDIWSPLEIAIKLNKLEIARSLIDKGQILPEKFRDEIRDCNLIFELKKEFDPQEAVMEAVENKNSLEVRKLINTGKVDVNKVYGRFDNKKTLLSVAVENGDIQTVDVLLAKDADPNFGSILQCAIDKKDEVMIDKLSENGINMKPAIYIALNSYRNFDREFWGFLLIKGADISYRDKSITDDSLLRLAVEKRDEYIIQLLHDNGVDMGPALGYAINSSTCFGESEEKFYKKLLSMGADINYDDENYSTWIDPPLVCCASRKYDKPSMGGALADFLLKNGADVNVRGRDIHGNYNPTALYYAAKRSNHYIVDKLLSQRANPNLKGDKFPTPLHEAVGDLIIMERLLSKGAKVNVIDYAYNGRTPIHYAAINAYPSSIEMLLNKGAKCSTDTDGYTPLDVLYKYNKKNERTANFIECERLLIDAGFKYKKFSNRNV